MAASSLNASSGTVVLFGGTGFIGTHLAMHWLRENLAQQVVLVDLNPPRLEPWTAFLQEALSTGRAVFVQWDVRQPIPETLLPKADLIFNLAAVHREPGHQPHEYFETNLQGAENVCTWASAIGCSRIVFTSSIAPYGPSEEMRNEASLPVPDSPYGSSKLAAEKMHMGWQAGRIGRKLLILRPGVVFGPGEGGNVTRLVRSLVKGYFVYTGNRETRKAGGYVKELCRVVRFALEHQDTTTDAVTLLNFSLDPPPTLETYVAAIRKVAGIRRSPPTVPRWLLLGVSHPIHAVASTLGIRQPISPVRVRKTFRSTSIDPRGLRELGYPWYYTLEEALEDWKSDLPSDFSRQPKEGSTAGPGNALGRTTTQLSIVLALLLSIAGRGHAQSADDAHRIFDLTNQDRHEHGLPALRWDDALAAAAQTHADRMVHQRTLSHQLPGEPELMARAASAGAHFRAIAENIATGPNANAIDVEWMHSPSHRANILDPKMDALGVAVARVGGVLYAVEDFEQSSEALTRDQVEERIRTLLHAQGVDASSPSGPAEEACAMSRGIPEGSNARSIVRFETPDLSQLPSQVLQQIRAGDFRKAAVGACTPGASQANFTTYRVAILLY